MLRTTSNLEAIFEHCLSIWRTAENCLKQKLKKFQAHKKPKKKLFFHLCAGILLINFFYDSLGREVIVQNSAQI